MATPEFHNGSDGKAYVKPPGGAAFIAVGVTGWNLTVTSNNKDVSNTVSGRKRIPGVPDASGDASLHYDSANFPSDTTTDTGLNLRAGSIIGLELAEDGAASGSEDSFRLSAIIDTVEASSDFDGTIDYKVTFSLEDGSTLKYPGDSA